MLSLDLPLALLSTSVKTLTFSRKKDSPLTYSCQFIFIWMAYITGSFVIFHVHKLLPCLRIVTSKYDIWDWLTCTVVGGGGTYGHTDGHVITKISRICKLPYFLTHGTPLRARAPLLCVVTWRHGGYICVQKTMKRRPYLCLKPEPWELNSFLM